MERIRDQKPFFMPNPYACVSFVYEQDAAGFLATLLEREPSSDCVNCASLEPIELRELMQLIGRLLGQTPLFAADATLGDSSPYGFEGHCTLDLRKLSELYRFAPQPIPTWLPGLVPAPTCEKRAELRKT